MEIDADTVKTALPDLSVDVSLQVLGRDYPVDEETNVTSHLLKHTDRLLHLRKQHPIQIIKQRIVENMQVRGDSLTRDC